MGIQGLTTVAALAAVLTAGCTATESHDDLDLRMWGAGDDYAGNGDIEVRAGDDDDDDIPDTIIWDILGGSVSRQTTPGVFEQRLIIADDDFLSATGPAGAPPMCTVVATDHPSGNEFQLVDKYGEVVFTVWKRFVFAGDVSLPLHPHVKNNPSLHGAIAVSFKKKRIYSGGFWEGDVLATANERIARSTPERRLLLAALVSGECGSDGLPH
ncbi:MAG: hypothetical protein K0V04_24100 [Deltaproteobacteria bacterium]|nr:hypothetical protein [Deltaproteobacteria bacterium]